KTFGCQMNEYDSELIWNLFEQEGYVLTDNIEEADVILFNTCSIREHAEARVWGQAGILAKIKNKKSQTKSAEDSSVVTVEQKDVSGNHSPFTIHQRPIIGIVGCMAQNYQEKIFEKLPHVNLVCGPGNIYDLPRLVSEIKQGKEHLLAVNGSQSPHAIGPKGKRKNKLKAFVTITEGCDNFCSYCIVPFVRARQVSRKSEEILEEVRYLADNGAKEITLLGQNVNSYGQDLGLGKEGCVKLLEEVSRIRGLERVRFTTNHPKDTGLKLFKLMAKNKKICPHLHLPLQSGSDRILKLMNRKYTVNHYLKMVNLYRKLVEDASLTTDIIVGFPTETEKDFKATFDLMKEIAFDGAFIFKYSPRFPAAAACMEDDVPQEVKKERNQILLDLQKKMSLNRNRLYLGREVEVLVERMDNKNRNLMGRTSANKTVVFAGEEKLIGKIVKVMVKDVTESTLIGSMER
ncbi:MAG: tRNA (N6-isopentenyl adenosine(37)-C2)-methylthiotransferase MiaB, partial [Candidatus Omnitrophota bacterium]